MAVVVHYCDNCGIRIEPDDVEDGRAVVSGDKAYCPECAKKLNATGQKQKKQAKPPVRKSTTRVGTARKKATSSYAKKPKWEEPPDDYEYESKRFAATKKKSTLPVFLGIGGVVVVIIIIAIAAGGSDKPAPDNRNPQQPYTPEYKPEPDTGSQKPYGGGPQKPPSTSPALIRFQEALEYGKRNPESYAAILERLESILNEDVLDVGLIDRIEREISVWNGRWDAVATKEWEKVSEAAKKLIEKDDYKGATKLYQDFPEKYKKFYDEKCQNEISRLERHVEAFEAFKGIESDIKAADGNFTVGQLEEAEALFWKLHAFGKKYEDVEELVIKLNVTLKKLWAKIEALEEQKFGE